MNTKSDSNQNATKKDTHELRNELKKTEKNLRAGDLKLEERLERVEDKVDAMDIKLDNVEHGLGTKIDKVANTLDAFLGRLDNLETDNEVGANQIHEFQAEVDDHKKRIAKLESRV